MAGDARRRPGYVGNGLRGGAWRPGMRGDPAAAGAVGRGTAAGVLRAAWRTETGVPGVRGGERSPAARIRGAGGGQGRAG